MRRSIPVFILLASIISVSVDRLTAQSPDSGMAATPLSQPSAPLAKQATDLFLARSLGGSRYTPGNSVFVFGGAAPGLVRLPKGVLLAVFEVLNWHDEPVLLASRSNDEGRTWTRGRGILVEGEGAAYSGKTDKGDRGGLARVRHADILRMPNGALRMYFTIDPNPGKCEIRSATSVDGLKYKLDPIPAAIIEQCNDARPGVVRTTSGFHLFVTILETTAPQKKPSAKLTSRVLHFTSRDGRKFKRRGEVKLGGVPASGFAAHAKGIRAIVTVDGNLRMATSRDGKDWSLETDILMTNARNASIVEMRDGTFLMAYERLRTGSAANEQQKSLVAVKKGRRPIPAGFQSAEDEARWREEHKAELSNEAEDADADAASEKEWPEFADESAAPEATEQLADVPTDENAQPGPETAKTDGTEDSSVQIPDAANDAQAEAEAERLAKERDEWLAVPDPIRPPSESLPPLPDFTTPFSYAEWYAQLCDMNTPDNAYWAYGEFMPSPLDPNRQQEWPVMEIMYNRADHSEPAPWDPAKLPDWEASYQASLPLLEKFQAASQHTGFARPIQFRPKDYEESPTGQPLLVGLLLPDLSAHRALVKQTLGANWRMEESGKPNADKMIEGWRTALSSANHMHQGATLIEQLVGTAEQSLVQSDARQALKQGVFKGKQLEEALALLEHNDHDDFDVNRSIQGEHAMVLDLMQAMFKSDKPGDPPRPSPEAIEKVIPLFGEDSKIIPEIKAMKPADVKKTLNAFETYYAEAKQAMAAGYPQVRMDDMNKMAEQHIEVSPLTKALLPAFGRIQKIRARSEASRRATQLSYAVHIYKEQNGHWPQSLNELPERFSTTMRTDPFTGGQFGYRVDENGPVIYSLSENGTDDGGRHATRWDDEKNGDSDDHVFWPVQPK